MKRKPKFMPRKKVRRAIKKVNTHAYTFKPEIVYTVAADPKHGRIMVKQIDGKKFDHPPPHLAALALALSNAARIYCMKERMHRGLGRECSHPEKKIKVLDVRLDSETTERQTICTKCGAQLFDRAVPLAQVVPLVDVSVKQSFNPPRIRRKA